VTENAYVHAVHLLPGWGEFAYDPILAKGYKPYKDASDTWVKPIDATSWVNMTYRTLKNDDTLELYDGTTSDVIKTISLLKEEFPNVDTIVIPIALFVDTSDVTSAKIYATSAYAPMGGFSPYEWVVSGLTPCTTGLPTLTDRPGTIYRKVFGGTPSDGSLVRCVAYLKELGYRIVLSPQINIDYSGYPRREEFGLPDTDFTASGDIFGDMNSSVSSFLGSAATSDFTLDSENSTVTYSGSVLDFTYRRWVLHYAHLAVLMGGVDLFVVGTGLSGLDKLRGTSWSDAGTTSSSVVTWDSPWISGMITLASDVRSIFDAAGYTKNTSTKKNLITYSVDCHTYMGSQYDNVDGVFPVLDELYMSDNIDYVSINWWFPYSDWTTGTGGLDYTNWTTAVPTTWPVTDPSTIGFGLTGTPELKTQSYLAAGIEGGEYFNYWYGQSLRTITYDPNDASSYISKPEARRLSQTRLPYEATHLLYAGKRFRTWWKSYHYATYRDSSGAVTAQGSPTKWVPSTKPIIFLEYGCPSNDKASNDPSVWYQHNIAEDSSHSSMLYATGYDTVRTSPGTVLSVPWGALTKCDPQLDASSIFIESYGVLLITDGGVLYGCGYNGDYYRLYCNVKKQGTLTGYTYKVYDTTEYVTNLMKLSDSTDWVSAALNTYGIAALNSSGELYLRGANYTTSSPFLLKKWVQPSDWVYYISVASYSKDSELLWATGWLRYKSSTTITALHFGEASGATGGWALSSDGELIYVDFTTNYFDRLGATYASGLGANNAPRLINLTRSGSQGTAVIGASGYLVAPNPTPYAGYGSSIIPNPMGQMSDSIAFGRIYAGAFIAICGTVGPRWYLTDSLTNSEHTYVKGRFLCKSTNDIVAVILLSSEGKVYTIFTTDVTLSGNNGYGLADGDYTANTAYEWVLPRGVKATDISVSVTGPAVAVMTEFGDVYVSGGYPFSGCQLMIPEGGYFSNYSYDDIQIPIKAFGKWSVACMGDNMSYWYAKRRKGYTGTAPWSTWKYLGDTYYYPKQDRELQKLVLKTFYEYMSGNNESVDDVSLVDLTFSAVVGHDVRPFPNGFPGRLDLWEDCPSYAVGYWINGKTDVDYVDPFSDIMSSTIMAFKENLIFPEPVSIGAKGGPRFAVDISAAGSAEEQRVSRWTYPLYQYDLTNSVQILEQLQVVTTVYLIARGSQYGFRFKDPQDHTSSAISGQVIADISATDQYIGTGDASTLVFQLQKAYTYCGYTFYRPIYKPISGTVLVSLDGVATTSGWSVDTATGKITFTTAPASGVLIYAGYKFHVPVRFDMSNGLYQNTYDGFNSGSFPATLVELRPNDWE